MKKSLGTMVAIMVVAILIGTFITAKYATAGEAGRDGRFIAYDNGTVFDTKTKLMWAAKDNGSDINWQGAKSYCVNYRGGGYTDWRMPTMDELPTLYDGYSGGRIADCAPTSGTIFIPKAIGLSCYSVWADEEKAGSDTVPAFSFGQNGHGHLSMRTYMPRGGGGVRALPVRSAKSGEKAEKAKEEKKAKEKAEAGKVAKAEKAEKPAEAATPITCEAVFAHNKVFPTPPPPFSFFMELCEHRSQKTRACMMAAEDIQGLNDCENAARKEAGF